MQTRLGVACVHTINESLRTQPDILEALIPFAGTVLAISLRGPEKTLAVRIRQNGLLHYEILPPEQPTIHIIGTPFALYRTLRDTLRGSFVWSSRLRIEGDMGVLQAMSHILHRTPIDWEACLAEYLGDFWAYGMVKHGKRLFQWQQTVVDHTTRSVVDYLQHETMLLPSAAEVATFCAEVDALSESVARLEAQYQTR